MPVSFQTSTGQFFTADTTHSYVIPLPSSRFDHRSAGISPGSVAAVVYNGKVVYAVFADEGPDDIIGEASYATAQALGIDPNPASGGTEGPVTFIVFPGHVPDPVENNTTIDSVGADNTVRALGKCMDVTSASTADGAKVQLYDCHGSNAQKWTRSGSTLVNTGSGRCLDATGPSSADGTRLQIRTCAGGANQTWTLPS